MLLLPRPPPGHRPGLETPERWFTLAGTLAAISALIQLPRSSLPGQRVAWRRKLWRSSQAVLVVEGQPRCPAHPGEALGDQKGSRGSGVWCGVTSCPDPMWRAEGRSHWTLRAATPPQASGHRCTRYWSEPGLPPTGTKGVTLRESALVAALRALSDSRSQGSHFSQPSRHVTPWNLPD